MLWHFLWAATTYAQSNDPSQEINTYIVTNNLLPSNVRVDSGQSDIWRDYQQVLSELGLIYSTRLVKPIAPTPLGLAFLDGSLSFTEVITTQALRFQYPNGHHVQSEASSGGNHQRQNFALLQSTAGVRLRPCVLLWQTLRILSATKETASLNADEVERYLMRCTTHSDLKPALAHLMAARRGEGSLPRLGKRQRRKAQDWLKFLGRTALFSLSDDDDLTISDFGFREAREIDSLCVELLDPGSFWEPVNLDKQDKLSWYAFFGTVNVLDIPASELSVPRENDFVGGQENDEDDQRSSRNIQLRAYESKAGLDGGDHASKEERFIQAVYSAGLSGESHRLHDTMVELIARRCSDKNAKVYEDRATVDLLVSFKEHEFLIEVKSVNFKNLVVKIRLGLGQILHYDYLRSLESAKPRRKVLAIAANIPASHWSVPFVTKHVKMDLLCLDRGTLRVYSEFPSSLSLFS